MNRRFGGHVMKKAVGNYSRERGAVSAIIAVLAVCVASIGFFAAEIWYAQLASAQLKNCCDAASIGAAAALASSKNTDNLSKQAYSELSRRTAKALALKLFQNSSVVGSALNGVVEVPNVSNIADSLPCGKAAVSIKFLNASGMEAADGKRVAVSAAYGVRPLSGKLLGSNKYIVTASGHSAAAKLDLSFCLDDSASMATDTPIVMVRREWDPATSSIKYVDIYHGVAKKTGSQGIPEPTYLGANSPEQGWRTTFSPSLRGTTGDVGVPPGNYPNLSPYSASSNVFTDRLVNPNTAADGSFQPCAVDGYSFPDLATLVEAERGNLESLQLFKDSKADTAVKKVTPRAGYKEAYEKMALLKVEPFSQAKTEIKKFFEMMDTNTDSHFALIPFSQKAAASESDEQSDWRVSPAYPQGGKVNYPFNQVAFAQTSSRYADVRSKIDTYHLHGGTRIQDSIDNSIALLNNHSQSRSDARKAILLFTDGDPTAKKGEDAVQQCFDAAGRAKEKGIAIYAIGFLHGGRNSRSEATLQGIVDRGAPGGKLFVVQEVSGLHEVFRLISRQLVTLN